MNNELQHHGILGQKWGVRRYQNEDGSLTSAGKKRTLAQTRADRAKSEAETAKKLADKAVSFDKKRLDDQGSGLFKYREKRLANTQRRSKAYTDAMDRKAAKQQDQADKPSKVNTAKKIVTGILIGYGAYKLTSLAASVALGTSATRSVLKKSKGTGAKSLSSMTMRDLH